MKRFFKMGAHKKTSPDIYRQWHVFGAVWLATYQIRIKNRPFCLVWHLRSNNKSQGITVRPHFWPLFAFI